MQKGGSYKKLLQCKRNVTMYDGRLYEVMDPNDGSAVAEEPSVLSRK